MDHSIPLAGAGAWEMAAHASGMNDNVRNPQTWSKFARPGDRVTPLRLVRVPDLPVEDWTSERGVGRARFELRCDGDVTRRLRPSR